MKYTTRRVGDAERSRDTSSVDIVLMTIPNNMESVVGWGAKFVTPLAPYGLMYIASAVREAGRDCAILDCYAESLGVQEALEYLGAVQAKIVGLSIMTSQAFIAGELMKRIRERYPDIKIVLGNLHADIFADWFLSRRLADAVVHGEGELTFVELCDAYLDGAELRNVAGISAVSSQGEVFQTSPREAVRDLDTLPIPAWDLVPHHLYRFPIYFHPPGVNPRKSLHMFTSRGCPYNCVFCTVHKNRTIRYHSIPRVMQEIRFLTQSLGADYIFMMDSLFTTTTQRITELCEGFLQQEKKFTWGCEGRVNFIARHPEILPLMRQAGCVHISYGIESGDQQVLDRAKKQTTIDQIEQAVRYTEEAGIEAEGLFMLGLPGDTEASMRKTLDLAKRLPFGYAQFAITTPFPGSELYYELVEQQAIDPFAWDQFSQYASLANDDAAQLVYVPEGLTSHDLYVWQKRALREYYLRWAPVWRTIRNFHVRQCPELFYSGLLLLSGIFSSRRS